MRWTWIVPLLLAAGCSSTPVAVSKATPAVPTASTALPKVAAPTAPPAQPAAGGSSEQAIAALEGQSFFFAYDNYAVDARYAGLLKRYADVAKALRRARLTLEGNADERGSKEYNLALGQKRADAVAAALRTYGVADTQMESVSLGEEKPRANCHDESCWQENRRVDVRVDRR